MRGVYFGVGCVLVLVGLLLVACGGSTAAVPTDAVAAVTDAAVVDDVQPADTTPAVCPVGYTCENGRCFKSQWSNKTVERAVESETETCSQCDEGCEGGRPHRLRKAAASPLKLFGKAGKRVGRGRR